MHVCVVGAGVVGCGDFWIDSNFSVHQPEVEAAFDAQFTTGHCSVRAFHENAQRCCDVADCSCSQAPLGTDECSAMKQRFQNGTCHNGYQCCEERTVYCTRESCSDPCRPDPWSAFRSPSPTPTYSSRPWDIWPSPSPSPSCHAEPVCHEYQEACGSECVRDVSMSQCRVDCANCYSPTVDWNCWTDDALDECSRKELRECPEEAIVTDSKSCGRSRECVDAWFGEFSWSAKENVFRDANGDFHRGDPPQMGFDVGLGFAVLGTVIAILVSASALVFGCQVMFSQCSIA